MFKYFKKTLLKYLTRNRIKPSYDDLSYEDKVSCNEIWRIHRSPVQKIAKIVIGDVIQQYAKTKREVEFAKEILTLQNDLIKTYHDLVEKNQKGRMIH